MNSNGGYAFPAPGTVQPHQHAIHTWPESGMTYRDWLVGGMMREYFKAVMTAGDQLAFALVGEERIREAVDRANKIADIVIQKRNEP